MRVLIVEDNKIASKVMGILLTKADCTFDVAETGTKAIQLYFTNTYDLILMDLGLPDISGITVSKIMRQHQHQEYKQYTHIAALTAHCDNEYKQEAQSAGIDWFLTKPVDDKCLFDIINKLKKLPGPETPLT